jgi:elongator complex protein 3
MTKNVKIIKELIEAGIKTRVDLERFKRKMAKKYKIACPTNISLLKTYHRLVKNKSVKRLKKLENLLKTRPVRSLSGIVNVSVLTKPYPCPGECIYCPVQKGVPKSYLDNEPAVMRAILNKYNPFQQAKTRVEALEDGGHPTDKIELRIIGGTWSFYPKTYQTYFIKRCFDACNQRGGKNLEESQKRNEISKHRIVGISVETRPDFITEKEVKRMRRLGITRVELGVQSIYNDVLKLNKRGHDIKATIKATKLLKDAGLKVSYQMMPNLLGSNLSRDKKMFKELFLNPNFRPDLLKIYPCALLKEASLYKDWERGKYKPYTLEELIKIIKEIKKEVPYYVRIQRIVRDIPAQSIVAGGTKTSNLRQVVAREMKKEGVVCCCIRCREVREDYRPKERLKLFREDYDASEGREVFLGFESKNRKRLYSLLRLRIPSRVLFNKKHFLPVLDKAALIREIHTYGSLHPLKEDVSLISPQHKGLGKKLMKIAERIAKKEFGLNKIAVISAIGTRDYFKKLGYQLKEEYMIKLFSTKK